MYLFIFAALIAIYQYMNTKKISESFIAKEEQLRNKITALETKAEDLDQANYALSSFYLPENDAATAYIENQGLEVTDVIVQVEDAVLGMNKADADNALVPFVGIEGKMRINKMRILNHKWIVAEFTDGKYWGEVFLSYEINEKKELSLATEKAFLYPVGN
ncbi:hypothetical protein GCM10009117_00470 [Gangjinia marincola]|uniref:Hydrolase n=2 Tax=Gangjinia marincola TaxID=578463 RepID=A0ABP3XTI6_9FLAO